VSCAPCAPGRFTPTRVGTLCCPPGPGSRSPVHPHTRGDISIGTLYSWAIIGSPPHAWGHSEPDVSALPKTAVHPHTRGDIRCCPMLRAEYVGSPPHAWGHWGARSRRHGHAAGSPPHAWGHLGSTYQLSSFARFTPTRVGTFQAWQRGTLICPVHPHTRGDIDVVFTCFSPPFGSPPHAWGHLDTANFMLLPSRFTPTRVGTLPPHARASYPVSVHPHTRGDIAEHEIASVHARRFTPTRVGTLAEHSEDSMRRLVHPHTRGDISCVTSASVVAFGSPPHAWGHCSLAAPRVLRNRFTPTRVGTFSLSARVAPRVSVHPHTRGDIVTAWRLPSVQSGSPPHAWGHCRVRGFAVGQHRFTPTRVGTFTRLASYRYRSRGSPPHAWGHFAFLDAKEIVGRFTPTRVGTFR